MNNPEVSLIISTYNWPQALELCLTSIQKQTVQPQEIVIADDGSTEETLFLIEKMRKILTIPLVHCWHPDEGFRLARIRNRALEKCHYPYIIQIDGDIICHHEFIKDHLCYAHPDFFVSGKRVNLNEDDTQLTLSSKSLVCSTKSLQINKFSHRSRTLLLARLLKPRFINNAFNKGVLGSNMAFWLNHATLIGGYNEKIEGWGKEDDEFTQRLINFGIRKRGIRFSSMQYHLNHKRQSTENFEKNCRILEEAVLGYMEKM